MIENLAELKKFFALCRKQGVQNITYGSVSVTFGDLPTKKAGDAEETDDPETDGLTDEQLMFFSVGGVQQP